MVLQWHNKKGWAQNQISQYFWLAIFDKQKHTFNTESDPTCVTVWDTSYILLSVKIDIKWTFVFKVRATPFILLVLYIINLLSSSLLTCPPPPLFFCTPPGVRCAHRKDEVGEKERTLKIIKERRRQSHRGRKKSQNFKPIRGRYVISIVLLGAVAVHVCNYMWAHICLCMHIHPSVYVCVCLSTEQTLI